MEGGAHLRDLGRERGEEERGKRKSGVCLLPRTDTALLFALHGASKLEQCTDDTIGSMVVRGTAQLYAKCTLAKCERKEKQKSWCAAPFIYNDLLIVYWREVVGEHGQEHVRDICR